MAIHQQSAVLPNKSDRLSFTQLIIASEVFLARDQFESTQNRSLEDHAVLRNSKLFASTAW